MFISLILSPTYPISCIKISFLSFFFFFHLSMSYSGFVQPSQSTTSTTLTRTGTTAVLSVPSLMLLVGSPGCCPATSPCPWEQGLAMRKLALIPPTTISEFLAFSLPKIWLTLPSMISGLLLLLLLLLLLYCYYYCCYYYYYTLLLFLLLLLFFSFSLLAYICVHFICVDVGESILWISSWILPSLLFHYDSMVTYLSYFREAKRKEPDTGVNPRDVIKYS